MRIDLSYLEDVFLSFLKKHDFVAVLDFPRIGPLGMEQVLFRNAILDLRLSTFRSEIGVDVMPVGSSAGPYEIELVLEMMDGRPAQALDEHNLLVFISRMESAYEEIVRFFSPEGAAIRDKYLLWSEERY